MSRAVKRRFVPIVAFLSSVVLQGTLPGPPAGAAIYRWDNGELITDMNAEPWADLSGMDLSYADLVGAPLSRSNLAQSDLSYAHLMGADFFEAGLTAVDFTSANLTNVRFWDANLTDAGFSRAIIIGADFQDTTIRGFTAEQLYATASYQSGDLRQVDLVENDLRGWNFAGQDLTDANLGASRLTDADFTGAVVTRTVFNNCGASFTVEQLYSTANYQSGDLSGIGLKVAQLAGCDFAGKNLSDAYFEKANLSGADFSGADLTNADCPDANLASANFTSANLTNVRFWRATLAGADFSGAIVTGASFADTTARGFTADQLYSTSSYQIGDLSGIRLTGNDLTSWDFAGKDLTNAELSYTTLTGANFSGATLSPAIFRDSTLTGANFSGANLEVAGFYHCTLIDVDFSGANLPDAIFRDSTLTGANFSGASLPNADLRGANLTDATLTQADLSYADLRGSRAMESQGFESATTENAILPDGRIEGLSLDAGQRLTIRDYNHEPAIPITVESAMDLGPAAALRFVFEDEDWGSTISFPPGTTVSLDGTLELFFALYDDYYYYYQPPEHLIGTTFDLFDWDGAIVSGTFDEEIVTEWEAVWDTSRLYTTGEVTLLSAIPEPSILLLLGTGLLATAMYGYRRRKRTESAESR